MQLVRAVCALAAAASALLLILFLQARSLREGQLAAGTCEIVTLDRDSSQPRRTIARQTARCACRKGQIAGTTRASPACVDGKSQAAFIQALVPLYPNPLEHTRVAFDPRDYTVCSPKVHIVRSRQWCEMMPCLDDEGCNLLINRSGWRCAQPGGKVKTTTVS